ncbi:MAG: DMT family transporter [Candidatus Omnitrophota bacterium]|jgi:drug/metabolite transporter (DMT)-like permease
MIHNYLAHSILGSFAALISAFAWALGSILFRRLGDKVSPLGMNLGKLIIGILYLGAILLFTGIKPMGTRELIFLGASGLLGIALGDTLFFRALIYLGPRLTVLLGTTGPVVTILLAVIFLKERPSALAWTGIFLVLTGITSILWQHSPKGRTERNYLPGIKYLSLSIICTSIGIIFAKIGVSSTSALQALYIRFLAGAIGLAIFGCANRKLTTWLTPFKDLRLLKFILFTVFIVVFGGFWLFLLSLKYIDASVATILNSTEPLFILPLAAFMLKEKILFTEIIGAVIAVSGVVMILMG